MNVSVQSLVAGALNDVAAVAQMGDEELLATEWLWALRERPSKANEPTEAHLQSQLIEDLLLIASLEGQGRQLAQTTDGMTRFLSFANKARVIEAINGDVRGMITTDDEGRVRLNPRRLPEALRFIGVT